MTLLQQFPSSSTSTNREFFESRMKKYIEQHLEQCRSLINAEIQDRESVVQESDGDVAERVESLTHELEEYNKVQQERVRDRTKRSAVACCHQFSPKRCRN